MEMVSEFLRRHGYEMGRNEIVEGLRKEGLAIGNIEIKQVIDALVMAGSVSYRKTGQKYLYGHLADFISVDVSAWTPDA